MEEKKGQLPRVVDDVMPPLVPERGGYLRMLLSRAEPGTVRYTRVEQWEIVGAQPAALPGAKRTRTPLAIGAAALVAVTALLTWWLTAPSPPPARTTGVTVSLPTGNAAPKATPTIAPPAQVAAVAAAPAVAATPELETSTTPRTEQAALARAFATNEAWPWQGETTRGLVVVGPGEIVAGQLCRDVAIMTRGENTPDRTVNGRKCQQPGGAIVEADPPGQ